MENKKKERYFGLDLIRTLAIIFVVLIHSFGNTGYNAANMSGISMFLLLLIRCLVFVGVLLFITLTGYCKTNKTISKDHYSKIKKILLTYVVISTITFFFRKLYMQDDLSLYNGIIGIFNFSTLPYAWYVEMYIGLFLLIPFFNILYKNTETKKQKQILIISLIAITSIPQTLQTLSIANHTLDILPAWWGSLYPILLYFIGCYIKEYQPKINKGINLILISIVLLLQSIIIYFYCQGNSVNTMIIIDYNYFPAILLSTLLFTFLYDIKIRINIIKKIITFISERSFSIYLFSYIYDKLIYDILKFNVTVSINSILGIVIYTPIIFGLSLLSASILDWIINKLLQFNTTRKVR